VDVVNRTFVAVKWSVDIHIFEWRYVPNQKHFIWVYRHKSPTLLVNHTANNICEAFLIYNFARKNFLRIQDVSSAKWWRSGHSAGMLKWFSLKYSDDSIRACTKQLFICGINRKSSTHLNVHPFKQLAITCKNIHEAIETEHVCWCLKDWHTDKHFVCTLLYISYLWLHYRTWASLFCAGYVSRWV